MLFFLIKCLCDLKKASICKWACRILNSALYFFIWSKMWKISSFFWKVFNSANILPRDVIRRLCNRDRGQGSKGIWGLGIDRIVTYEIHGIPFIENVQLSNWTWNNVYSNYADGYCYELCFFNIYVWFDLKGAR